MVRVPTHQSRGFHKPSINHPHLRQLYKLSKWGAYASGSSFGHTYASKDPEKVAREVLRGLGKSFAEEKSGKKNGKNIPDIQMDSSGFMIWKWLGFWYHPSIGPDCWGGVQGQQSNWKTKKLGQVWVVSRLEKEWFLHVFTPANSELWQVGYGWWLV